MAESKYSKYIVTEMDPRKGIPSLRAGGPPPPREGVAPPQRPPEGIRRAMEHVIWMDNDVVPGAFYAEFVWFWPGQTASPEEMRKRGGVPAHTHPFDELLAYFGTNLDDPYDLGGEVELWLEDEPFVMTKSFIAYIPAGMKHCPLINVRIDRPMFHFTMGPGKIYTKEQ